MPEPLITWPELVSGTLIRRYKRFLADIELSSGEIVTAHCPNPGRMLECSEQGRKVRISRSSNPSRKLAYTWEVIETATGPVVVNTLTANRLAKAAVMKGIIPELAGYPEIRTEMPAGSHSRIDLCLSGRDLQPCLVEVKSCTYVEQAVAMFPDAVSERGRRHLVELRAALGSGMRSVLLILIQRMDARLFRPADHIDPKWGSELRKAHAAGVELLVYSTHISSEGIALADRIPFKLV
ncbi:MAG TPA: DNA/RNA nuclease SfsA [Deltaproteobacteria bacterium]|jgi:sugar fermentation stimulation protein A|nr:DNA/RNA nuclease SfsA [Deltaproteobacteria bacterium]HQJ08733.1 DNA/RNA nuclease SfsA [Deltaproteobacteria bacterium]